MPKIEELNAGNLAVALAPISREIDARARTSLSAAQFRSVFRIGR